MKFSCDQCNAQYMIADEKVGARGVKVKCKKCAHIIIVKPATAEEKKPTPPAPPPDAVENNGGGFGSPFNEPTQAMSAEQLASLKASTAEESSSLASGNSMWPPSGDQATTDDSFGAPFGASDSSAGSGGTASDFGSDGLGVSSESLAASDGGGSSDSFGDSLGASSGSLDSSASSDNFGASEDLGGSDGGVPSDSFGASDSPGDSDGASSSFGSEGFGSESFGASSSFSSESGGSAPADTGGSGEEDLFAGSGSSGSLDAEDLFASSASSGSPEGEDLFGSSASSGSTGAEDLFAASGSPAGADDGSALPDPSAGDMGFGATPGFGDPTSSTSVDMAGPVTGELNLDAALSGPAAPAPSSRPPGEKEWYVAIDESQIGPVDLAEIEQRWDGLELDEDSLAWKAGMQDWAPVAEIPELAYVVTERPQSRAGAGPAAPTTFGAVVTSPGTPTLGPVAFGGDTGGGSEPESDVSWTPSAASALSSLVQDELTTQPQADTVPDPGPSPADLGMPSFGASDLFGSGGNSGSSSAEEPAFSPPAASAPVTAPAPTAPAPAMPSPAADPFAGGGASWSVPRPETRRGGLKPVHLALFGLMGLMTIGLIVMVVLLWTRQPVAAPVANASVPAVIPTTKTVPAPATTVPAEVASVPSEPTEAAAEKSAGRSGSSRTASRTTRTRSGTKKTAGQTRPSGGRSKGGLDDIFDSPRPAKASGPPAKESLSKSDIMAGVKKGMAGVMGCIKTARAKGELAPGKHTLVLEWSIRPDGRVTSPRLKGPSYVLGTSLPACFGRGMRSWKFPASRKGGPVKNFPFGPFNIK
ncbi:GYF domain-containing protein [Myxococcota bacterium]